MNEFVDFIYSITPALITGLIAAVGTWVVAKTNKKGAREVALINELQEEIARFQGRLDSQDVKISSQSDKIQALEREHLDKEIYITLLKQHIIQQLPPPPPEWVTSSNSTT